MLVQDSSHTLFCTVVFPQHSLTLLKADHLSSFCTHTHTHDQTHTTSPQCTASHTLAYTPSSSHSFTLGMSSRSISQETPLLLRLTQPKQPISGCPLTMSWLCAVQVLRSGKPTPRKGFLFTLGLSNGKRDRFDVEKLDRLESCFLSCSFLFNEIALKVGS